jgi:hypothetical protein
MVSSGLLRRVALVRTDVSEEPGASFIRVTKIGEYQVFLRSVRRLLVAACVVPSSPMFVTLMEAPGSSETSVLTRATRRNNLEDTILHSHRREILKSYMILDVPADNRTGKLQSTCRISVRQSNIGLFVILSQFLTCFCLPLVATATGY